MKPKSAIGTFRQYWEFTDMSRVYWSRCFSFRRCCCPHTSHTHYLHVLTVTEPAEVLVTKMTSLFPFLRCNGDNWWSFFPSGSSLVFKDWLIMCWKCLLSYMWITYMQCPEMPEDGGKSPGTRVTGDCELPCGYGNQTWEKCFYSPSHPSGPFTSVFRNILA